MPKVSVIIPVYNVEPYLEECLNSVIRQTFPDMEILCIDDASTDHSGKLLRAYAKKDNRIRVLCNETNGGLARARNRGLGEASGEYVLFVDSDDYIEETLLEKVLEKAPGCDVVCFDYRRMDRMLGWRDSHTYSLADGGYSGMGYLAEAVENGSLIYSACTKLYRRDFLERNQIRFPDGRLYEDVLFCFRCLTRAERVRSFQEKLYIYRVRQNSVMTKALTEKNVGDYFWSVCELTKDYLASSCEKEAEPAIEGYIRGVCRDFIKARRKYNGSGEGPGAGPWDDKRYLKLYRIFSDFPVRTGSIQDFTPEQLRAAARKKIIVYGAGDIAREVIELLDRKDLAIYGVAVSVGNTGRKSLMGNRVLTIDQYLEVKDESLVIIGTSPRFYTEIEEELQKFGFLHYIEVM